MAKKSTGSKNPIQERTDELIVADSPADVTAAVQRHQVPIGAAEAISKLVTAVVEAMEVSVVEHGLSEHLVGIRLTRDTAVSDFFAVEFDWGPDVDPSSITALQDRVQETAKLTVNSLVPLDSRRRRVIDTREHDE